MIRTEKMTEKRQKTKNENRATGDEPRTTNYNVRKINKIMQNKPNLWEAKMNVSALLLTTNDRRLATREAQNKPNQTQLFRPLPPIGKFVSPLRIFPA